jgi:hypothetical protein
MSPRTGITLSAVAAAALLSVAMEPPLPAQAACSLTNATTWCAHQDSAGVTGGAEDDDRFAGALVFGDFDGDGFDDLAVGVPGENNDAGIVQVFYSGGVTLTLAGQQLFGQDDLPGADEGAENGDEFGAALASGDFDDDGFDDLVVGSPGEDLPEVSSTDCSLFECEDAGVVHVIYGGASGLALGSAEMLDTRIAGNRVVEGARFGSSFAVGDLLEPGPSHDNFPDLAIGAPRHDESLEGAAGAVFVAYGNAAGLDQGTAAQLVIPAIAFCEGTGQYGSAAVAGRFGGGTFHHLVASAPYCALIISDEELGVIFRTDRVFEDDHDVVIQSDYPPAGNSNFDHFGTALAAGDFDGDGRPDLAASAPDKDHGTGNPSDSGRVYVAYSRQGFLDPSDAPDIIGEDEWAGDNPGEGERFGSALAAGDVDGDGFDDLLAGAPGEGTFDVGRVYLKRGSAGGLTIANNALFTQTFLGGSNGDDDHLGNVIALGDVDGDGVLEIALGVPDKDVGTNNDAGMVYVTRAFGPRVFSDGFESGNKAAWSTSTP